MTELEEKLQRYLEQQEEDRAAGITLGRVYQATVNCADGLLALRTELLSISQRLVSLEAEYVLLQARVAKLEQQRPTIASVTG